MKTPDTPESDLPARDRRKATAFVLTTVKWALFAVVLYFVGRALYRQFIKVSWSEIRFDPLLTVLAIASILVAKGLSFLPYGLLLGRLGKFPGWLPVTGSVWAAQLGKYAPGKVGSGVGMVWLLRRYNVVGQAAVSTIMLIDGLSVILGMTLGVPLLLWEPIRVNLPMAWLWCLLVLLGGAVCLHPRVFGAVGNFLLRKLKYQPIPSLPKVSDYGWSLVVMLFQFTLLGSGYWLATRSIAPIAPSLLLVFISGVVVVFTGGFLAFFAPAGLGVQEGLFLIVLGPFIGMTVAAIVAVAMRFTQVLAEVVLALIGLLILRLSRGARSQEARAD